MWDSSIFTYTLKVTKRENNVQLFPFSCVNDEDFLRCLWFERIDQDEFCLYRGKWIPMIPRDEFSEIITHRFLNVIYGSPLTISHIQNWLRPFQSKYTFCKLNLFLLSLSKLLETRVLNYAIHTHPDYDIHLATLLLHNNKVLNLSFHVTAPRLRDILMSFRKKTSYLQIGKTPYMPDCIINIM